MSTSTEKDIAVKVDEAGKIYRVYHGYGRGWLLSKMLPFMDARRFYREIEALKDVSFTLNRGEVLGIVGRNGSGKSTLLKLIAGLSWPTSGKVAVHGKIRALLSLGINFHPNFSGRENIIFGSIAMGISMKIARRRMAEIIEFAELEEFIDMPIQFYSSGMRARLAAAVSFQESPEILIIDEALAAGDAYFVNKCMGRIEELCNNGSTVLFVSHGIALVERLCTQAILLEGGEMVSHGKPSDVVNEYRRVLVNYEINRVQGYEARVNGQVSETSLATSATDVASSGIEVKTSGTNEIELVELYMLDEAGERCSCFNHGARIEIVAELNAKIPIPKMRFYFELYTEHYGVRIAEIGSCHQSSETGQYASCYPENLEGRFNIRMVIPNNPLGSGTYYWNVYFAPPSGNMKVDTPSQYYCQAYNVCPFISFSFPGQEWARHRKSILEPAVDFEIERVPDKRAAEVLS